MLLLPHDANHPGGQHPFPHKPLPNKSAFTARHSSQHSKLSHQPFLGVALRITAVQGLCPQECLRWHPCGVATPHPCSTRSLQNATGAAAPTAPLKFPPATAELSMTFADELNSSLAKTDCCCALLALVRLDRPVRQLGLIICRLLACRACASCSMRAVIGAALPEQKNGTYCTSKGLGLHVAVAATAAVQFSPPAMGPAIMP